MEIYWKLFIYSDISLMFIALCLMRYYHSGFFRLLIEKSVIWLKYSVTKCSAVFCHKRFKKRCFVVNYGSFQKNSENIKNIFTKLQLQAAVHLSTEYMERMFMKGQA